MSLSNTTENRGLGEFEDGLSDICIWQDLEKSGAVAPALLSPNTFFALLFSFTFPTISETGTGYGRSKGVGVSFFCKILKKKGCAF